MGNELPVKPAPPSAAKKAMWWAGWVLTVLCSLGLLASAAMKFMPPTEEMKKGLEKSGLTVDGMRKIGVTEIACTVIYLIPQTSVLGAVLLTGYFGGATFAHVSMGESVLIPVFFGVLVWLGIYLRCGRLRAILPWRG